MKKIFVFCVLVVGLFIGRSAKAQEYAFKVSVEFGTNRKKQRHVVDAEKLSIGTKSFHDVLHDFYCHDKKVQKKLSHFKKNDYQSLYSLLDDIEEGEIKIEKLLKAKKNLFLNSIKISNISSDIKVFRVTWRKIAEPDFSLKQIDEIYSENKKNVEGLLEVLKEGDRSTLNSSAEYFFLFEDDFIPEGETGKGFDCYGSNDFQLEGNTDVNLENPGYGLSRSKAKHKCKKFVEMNRRF